jgi:hypothetical protein
MKTKYLIEITAALMLLAFNGSFSNARAQGTLTPPGAPGPTMLTLSQVEPRIPITSVPFVITNSGSYYLTASMSNNTYLVKVGSFFIYENTLANTNAITILANNVTVDLHGYSLTGISSSTNGILIGSVTNITICNGAISGFVNGVNSPSGGINEHVTGLTVSSCLDSGIILDGGTGSLVESCLVNNMGMFGIEAGTVRDSTAINCSSAAITAFIVMNCYAVSGGNGDAIDATMVENSEGASYGDYYNGITAQMVLNCYGYNNINGIGISGTIVQGSYGGSDSGSGIVATLASCSLGDSGGTPLNVTHNVNSFAY